MKKLLYITLSLLIFACSSDSADDDDPELLVSSITYNYPEDDDDVSYVENFTYDGKKIVQISTSNYHNGSLYSVRTYEYIYANNKISRVDYYDSDNNLTAQDYLTYDSQGRLVTVEFCCDESTFLSFSYSSDGSVTVTNSIDDSDGFYEYTTVLQFDDNENIISWVWSGESDAEGTLTYDNYNGPFKNITGASSMILWVRIISDSGLGGFNNNVVSGIVVYNINQVQYYATYDYNDSGYPINVVFINTESGVERVEETIVIEYFD